VCVFTFFLLLRCLGLLLSPKVPSTLDLVAKYGPEAAAGGVWAGLLDNANTGGENVHRGAVRSSQSSRVLSAFCPVPIVCVRALISSRFSISKIKSIVFFNSAATNMQVLGAALGGLAGASALPAPMTEGLKNRAAIASEIDAFVAVVLGKI